MAPYDRLYKASTMGKNCRHVRQALHLSEFRRALKSRPLFSCEGCAAMAAGRMLRAAGGSNSGGSNSRRGGKPLQLDPAVVDSPMAPGALASPSAAAAIESWDARGHWGDLCVCVTCGFIGCFSAGHFSAHFQVHPKHFVGFQAGSKTFWCNPCKMEVAEASKSKVEENRSECEAVFEDVVSKRVRQLRGQAQTAAAMERLSINGSSRGTGPGESRSDSRTEEDRGYYADIDSQRGGSARQVSSPVENRSEQPQESSPMVPDASNTTQMNGSRRGSPVELLNMPLKTKAQGDRQRRRMLKASPASPKPAEEDDEPTTAAMSCCPTTVLGFTNLGNTCYFNASIQALLTATHYFPEHTYIKETLEKADVPVLNTFTMLHETVKKRARKTLAEASSGKDGKPRVPEPKSRRHDTTAGRPRSKSSSVLTVAPLLKEMRKKFAQFRGDYQQDAHELFTSLLWAIDEETDPLTPVANSVSGSSDTTATSSVTTANADDDVEDESGDSGDEGTKQIFIKTETGETLSLQVPKSASIDEVQRLVAKRLNLNEEDMMLQGSRESVRASMPRVSRVGKMHSKLNLARNLFGGALTTVVTCQECGNRTETAEDAFIVSMSIPEVPFGQTLTITDCLRGFVRETRLMVDANNGYDCEKCSRQPKKPTRSSPFARKKKHGDQMEVVLRDATMRVIVSALPRVLAVHFKRLGRTKKITQHIVFDSQLDMMPYTSSSLQRTNKTGWASYELIAVVVHLGGKRGGHYVAYVSRSRRRELGRRSRQQPQDSDDEWSASGAQSPDLVSDERSWYYISDTVVRRVTLEQVLKCEAYMLFYQQTPANQ